MKWSGGKMQKLEQQQVVQGSRRTKHFNLILHNTL